MPGSRRRFLGGLAAWVGAADLGRGGEVGDRPALLGGTPVRRGGFPSWPIVLEEDLRSWADVLRSRVWCRRRGGHVSRFEEAWARKLGARHCVATVNGTNALVAALAALGVGPGDEVIVPPYTFVATVNAVLLHHALPVFVDTDRDTFQIDARRIEASVTERTRCLLPVHLGGNPFDWDAIAEVAGRRGLPIVEDACQAHLAEWRGRKVGTLGAVGCFSFQETKNLSSGEGGALVTGDAALFETCWSYHTNGRDRTGGSGFAYPRQGSNLRMTEFQGSLLLRGLLRIDAQTRRREENARHLTDLLRDVPGIRPAASYEGATRNAYHLYMLRYDPAAFGGLTRDGFLRALRAEGIPCSGGYRPLDREPFLDEVVRSRAFRRIYSPRRLRAWRDMTRCPENERLCREAVWLFQSLLLGSRRDMEDIGAAVDRVRRHGGELARAERA